LKTKAVLLAVKVAIFGVSGQLGRDVAAALSDHEVVSVEHARADVRDAASVMDAVRAARPAWVVNCAAMTHVDRCETEVLAAFEANGLGAANVARAARDHGARLIQISTDYVFDGARPGAYTETDAPRPINVYGMSKLAGEWAARAECPASCIVRSSGLYGLNPCRGKGSNFVETMLARAGAAPLRVVSDEVLAPTFTADLARVIRVLIDRDAPAGAYHATNAGSCSWFEFAKEIFRRAGKDARVEPIRAAEWKAAARRPANSVLENRALAALGVDAMPDWRDALARYLALRAGAPARGGS
jgi:dTDP-4-dehydrorhamnose reductase